MSKSFFDVFSDLDMKERTRLYFDGTRVERITMDKSRTNLRLYLTSDHLIPKEEIWAAEEEIARFVKKVSPVQVRIFEHFELSEAYKVKELLDLYLESIYSEIESYNFLMYQMLRKAELTCPEEDVLQIDAEDTFLNRKKESELVSILNKILCERCGIKAEARVIYHEVVSEKEDTVDPRLQARVEEITRRVYGRDPGEELLGAVAVKEQAPADGAAPASPAAPSEKNQAPKAPASAGSVSAAKPGELRTGGNRAKTDYGFSGGRRSGGGRRDDGAIKYTDNPDVIYGREVTGDITPMEDIVGEIGTVTIQGQVMAVDSRDIKNERTILMFDVTDFTDTFRVKIFVPTDKVKELMGDIKPGAFIRLTGAPQMDNFDHELSIGSVKGIQKSQDFRTPRRDMAVHKRVELNLHTKMSDMDGVSDAADLVKCALKFGHRAVAITDNGVVQGFTEANHVWEDLWKDEKKKRKEAGEPAPDKQDFFKILYGAEVYLVDDLLEIVSDERGQTLDDDFVVFDVETTGLSVTTDTFIEFGAVKVSGGKVVDRFSTFVNPGRPIPYAITALTSIRDEDVKDAPDASVAVREFLAFSEGCVLVAHNAEFDVNILKEHCKRFGYPQQPTYVDTLPLARVQLPGHAKYTLDAVAKALNIDLGHHHRAVDDAECTAWIFVRFLDQLRNEGMTHLSQINEKAGKTPSAIAKKIPHRAVIFAKNELGRVHLYHLITESHLTYFNRVPKVPKSRVNALREGLIVGSSGVNGEVYRAVVEGNTDEQVARFVQFYDYLEVQPIGNAAFLIDNEKISSIENEDDLRNANRRIVELGKEFGRPVVATGDVHFKEPQDEIYRRILMVGKGNKEGEVQAPLYFRTTEEMLEEFAYLGSEKAMEVVVTNTNMIADMCETISPVRPDKCPPVIPDSDKTLTEICYNRAHEIYGPDLPQIVVERLERELHSIITNGFAVMYIIAQKLVWKSVEDGYLVGSRGSVGSSFVATMAGITEVNPLSPHYFCSKCHYVDFDSDEVKAYAGKAGVDMPDKVCPVCGEPLHKDGFDIPFETFLGFEGDKEPDIDLNFSGEYQSKAHKYTEVIFGSGQTFRAGTVGTVAEKTAIGYVKHYFDEKKIVKRRGEVARIAKGCEGVRRSTGQHPGGIIVLPLGQDINSFTPVQHPANDMSTDIITTHFDYHSIDHNLLKLDILGHDDPTMIRMLQDLTGLDPVKDIPLDGQDVMSLFQNTEALGITPDDIGGTKLGALGIPEFGTDFAMQMLIDAQPKAFSDLVRISGLAHGTDVWLGNAETLIKSGKATISTAICTRDDIMTYLIGMGLDPSKSFNIMEAVRKGKVAKGDAKNWPAWKEDMLAHNVPDWYIWSCQKIKYMFPKAHAAAYVMMAWRIAYCKIHYPLAYYAAYFSIRAKAFSYELMCQGKAHLESELKRYKARRDADKGSDLEPLSNKEELQLGDMRIVQEMYARGFEFVPIDLFKVKSRHFQIVDGKLMPSLLSVEGLGETAADSIVEGAKKGPFTSRDDFKERCKVSQTVADTLHRLGILGELPESNQISIFDLFGAD